MNAPGDNVLNLSVGSFLDRLAERTPTPGGGSAAALAGSLACAMAGMVAAYSDQSSGRVAELAVRLARADAVLRRLVVEDIAAYQALAAAQRRAGGQSDADATRGEALLTATLVPMEMAATAVSALATMDELKDLANRNLLSDLGVAAVIARACVEAAGYSVRANLKEMADSVAAQQLLQQLGDLARRSTDLAASITRFVDRSLQPAGLQNR